jgi:predicted GNAT family N-acyltransferase
LEYTVIEEFNDNQLQELHLLFKNEWWTQKREFSKVKELVSNSGVVIGVINNETSELVGFARAITDSLYRAFIFDAITKQQYRNSGIGSFLMNSLLSHSKIVNVDRVELYCPERLIPYYEKFGFSTDVNGSILMRLKK